MTYQLHHPTAAACCLLTLAMGTHAAHADVTPSSAVVGGRSGEPGVGSAGTTRLIAQLGSERYVDRHLAQEELVRLGIKAFDDIQAATLHPDPEVAAAADFILDRIPIPWTTAGDAREVRQVMRKYGESPEARRRAVIRELATSSDRQAIRALCRIVRFDTTESLSRFAALAILRPRHPRAEPLPFTAESLVDVLAESRRRGSDWLRLYARQLASPAATLEIWQRELVAELAQAKASGAATDADDWQQHQLDRQFALDASLDGNEITNNEIVIELAWHVLRLQQQLDRPRDVLATFDRVVAHDPQQFDELAMEIIDWLAKVEAWESLDEFLAQHQERLATTRRPQYAAAIARLKQGQTAAAEELAEQALNQPVADVLERVIDASSFLPARQQWSWAEREYRHIIANEPVASQWSLYTRFRLADLLHDSEKHGGAAAELEFLETRIDQDADFRKAYNQAKEVLEMTYGVGLAGPKELSAQRHFLQACECRERGEFDRQKEHLLASIELDPTNPDVLIAMYRAPEAVDAWRRDVRARIAKMCRDLDAEIALDPEQRTTREPYNQWAWLVSNTEGDFQKAIRYSHKSLELVPDSPGCLDTLGRCYYAAGDYENALKYQRQAVELDPSMRVMQRQLELFEKALAEQE